MVRQSNNAIPPTLSESQIGTQATRLLQSEPLVSIIESTHASFYIFFARADRRDNEATAFLTERGRPYISPRKAAVAGLNRPVLRKADGGNVRPSEMRQSGWRTATLMEGRNHLNIAALEKCLHQRTLALPLGRRLHRKCGGTSVKPDALHMTFGVYVFFSMSGYGPFDVVP